MAILLAITLSLFYPLGNFYLCGSTFIQKMSELDEKRKSEAEEICELLNKVADFNDILKYDYGRCAMAMTHPALLAELRAEAEIPASGQTLLIQSLETKFSILALQGELHYALPHRDLPGPCKLPGLMRISEDPAMFYSDKSGFHIRMAHDPGRAGWNFENPEVLPL